MQNTVPSPALFGLPLSSAIARNSITTSSGFTIPTILSICFQEIESKSLDIEGIFRKSGSTATINQLQQQFESCGDPRLIKFPSTISSHNFAGLFKRYLQLLPQPVIPTDYQPTFLKAFDEEKFNTTETLKRRLKEACKGLPHEHLHLLQYLIEIAYTIQQHKGRNQMSIEALAIIFAPTCVRLDAISNSSEIYPNPFVADSTSSLPLMMNKQQLFHKARKLLWNAIKRKPQKDHQLEYKSKDLLQLELVKQSNTWIKIFEFMMTYPEVFTTLTNPLNSQKYKSDTLKTPNTAIMKSRSPIKFKSVWNTPFTQQEKKLLIDFNKLEFTESRDLLKTFENFEFKSLNNIHINME